METIFCIEMMKKGFLAYKQFKPSLAHKDKHIKAYSKAVLEVFQEIRNDPECIRMEGEPHQVGFKRLTRE